MDKNENGFPNTERSPSSNGGGCGCDGYENGGVDGRMSGNNGTNGGAQGIAENGCGGTSCIDTFPLAYVYAPNQTFRLLYSASEALKHGTLFEELYKPMEVYGRE